MTPQEHELLSTFLANLGRTRPEYTDAEAQAMIQRTVAEQPDAAYTLVRQALLQEMALRNAQAQIADLQAQLRQARGGSSAGASSGSFLGGAGQAGPSQEKGWANTPVPSSERTASAAEPWTQPTPPPAQSPTPRQGGGQHSAIPGFLSSVAATAAGVAGGSLLFQGLEHLFGGSHLSGLGTGLGTGTPTVEETVINEYGDELATDDNAQDGGENYANASDAGQNPGDDDTDGGDLAVDDDGSSWV